MNRSSLSRGVCSRLGKRRIFAYTEAVRQPAVPKPRGDLHLEPLIFAICLYDAKDRVKCWVLKQQLTDPLHQAHVIVLLAS